MVSLDIIFIRAIVMLREWLLPVMELTQTGQISLFLIFIGIAFLLSLMTIKWWLSAFMKILYIILAIHFISLNDFPVDKETTNLLLEDFI